MTFNPQPGDVAVQSEYRDGRLTVLLPMVTAPWRSAARVEAEERVIEAARASVPMEEVACPCYWCMEGCDPGHCSLHPIRAALAALDALAKIDALLEEQQQ